MRINTKLKAVGIAVGLCFAVNSLAEDTIKIALAGPTTGPVTQYGTMQKEGATLAIDHFNAKGGMNGKTIEPVILDDACEPKQAVSVANKIINDEIKFVIGHLCSSATIPAAALYDEEGILMVTGASTAPALTEKGYRFIFRTIGLDSQQAPFAAQYVINEIKPKNVAIIHDKQQYGQGIAKDVEKSLKDAGVNVVIFEGVSKGQQDFSALITKLKSKNVDFVYYGGYHPELGLILRQAGEQGLKAQFMGPEGVGNPDISAIAGKFSENLLVTLPADFSSEPRNAEIVKELKERGDGHIGPFVLPSYAAVQVIVDTANKIKSNDPEKIAEAIRKETFNTPIGEISYQDNGDLKSFKFVVYKWHEDGTKTAVTK